MKETAGIRRFPTTFEKIVQSNRMVIEPRARRSNREKFSRLLSERGLLYAAKHSDSAGRKVIKAVKLLLPNGLKPMLRKAYYAIKGKRA